MLFEEKPIRLDGYGIYTLVNLEIAYLNWVQVQEAIDVEIQAS